MSWMMYILGALCVGAVVLALYEWRKGLKMRHDTVLPDRANRHVDPMAQARQAALHKGDGRFDEPG